MKLTLIFALISAHALAAKRIVIYTDQADQSKANGLVQYMSNQAPFNEFDIEYDVVAMSTSDLGCNVNRNGNAADVVGANRNITCNNSGISRAARRAGYDQAMVVVENENYGGSGGSVPVMTTSDSSPYSMMVHEYLHTIGFGDEYPYATSGEADTFCTTRNMRRFINLAMIDPRDGGYNNDAHARRLHDDDIPWYSLIPADIPITSGRSLGTPNAAGPWGAHAYGLFPAETCINASQESRRTVWRPGVANGIMTHLHLGVGELEPLVRIALESQNFPRRAGASDIALSPPRHEHHPRVDFTAHEVAPTCRVIDFEPVDREAARESSFDDFERINNVLVNGVQSSPVNRAPVYLQRFPAVNSQNSSAVTIPTSSQLEFSTPESLKGPTQYKPRGKIDNPYMKIDFLKP